MKTRNERGLNRRMKLANVTSEPEKLPDRIFCYGEEGVGKTTFGAEAPKAIFIPAEVRFRGITVARYPRPESFAEVLEALDNLITEDHEYETVVLDTLSAIEPLVFADVCEQNSWDNIEEPRFKAGQQLAVDWWRRLIGKLDRLRSEKGMEVIVLDHSRVATFRSPEQEREWHIIEPAVDRYAFQVWHRWADTILFCQFEKVAAHVGGKGKWARYKGRATGLRIMRTTHSAAFRAKNTYNLPEVLPMGYEPYAEAREAAAPASPEDLWAELDALLELVPAEEREQKEPALRDYAGKNHRNLVAAVNRLRSAALDYTPEEPESEEASDGSSD